MSDSECEISRKSERKIYRSESEEEEPPRKSKARARKPKVFSDSESDAETKKPSKAKAKKSTPAAKKRKTTDNSTSRKEKKLIDVFGFGIREDLDVPSVSKPKTLPSYIINRVANGSERRSGDTAGKFYVDFKVYETSDALNTNSADLWKKALVRIKFCTNEDTEQWRRIQRMAHSISSLFEEDPRFYADK